MRRLQVQLYQRQGQAAAAQSQLTELMAEAANHSELQSLALAAAAELASATDQHQRAAAEFGKAIEAAPETVSQRQLARYSLGKAKAQFAQNQIDLAAADLNTASVLDNDPDWLRLAARIAVARGNQAEAADFAHQAREVARDRWTEEDAQWLDALIAAAP